MKKSKYVSKEEKIKAVEAFHNGDTVITLARIYKQERQTIYNWIKKYDKNPELTRVEGSGRKNKISQVDVKKLLKCLMKPASGFGFETDLWNTTRIKILLKKEFKLVVSKMAIWRTLSAHDFSYKKVQKVYLEVNRTKQKKSIEELLINIKRTIKRTNAILYFEDESNIQLSPTMGKTWAPIGEKVYHKVTANRGSVSAISALSNDGRLIFNLYDKSKRFKSDDIINFLQQMLKQHPRRHLVVIMDQAPCHTSKKVKSFVEKMKRLHVFYLPARSPEYNPDEQVWGYLKNHSLKSHQETTVKGLKKLTNKKMKGLAKNKSKLMGIFKRCDNHFLYL